MRFATSFYNPTLGRKTAFRFWPIWGLYLVIWTIAMPLYGLMMMRLDAEAAPGIGDGYLERWARSVNDGNGTTATVLALIFGCMAAMAVCSHLYSARSANFMGALAPRRTAQFFTGYLTGLGFLLVPNVIVFVLSLLVELAGGAAAVLPLANWLLTACLASLFFYSLGVLCGMFTGHLLALPVFYIVFNWLAVGLSALVSAVLEEFYYGYSQMGQEVKEVVLWLTPVNHILSRGEENAWVLLVYAAAGVVMAAASWLLYRFRRLETAGDVVAWKGLRPVFQYGVALCAGLFLGYMTRLVLGLGELELAVAILLWGLAGYFVARMLLIKSFRVLRYWKGGAAVAAVFLLLFAAVKLDITGFENRVPAAEDVASVEVYGLSLGPGYNGGNEVELEDPDFIRLITRIHRLAVEERDEGSTWLRLTYRMKNGGTISRRYWLDVKEEEMDEPGTVSDLVRQAVSSQKYIRQALGLDEAERAMAQGGQLQYVEVEDALTWETTVPYDIARGSDAVLLEALRADIQAGHIGWQKQPGRNEIRYIVRLEWRLPAAEEPEEAQTQQRSAYVSVDVTSCMTHTIAAMDELGLLQMQPQDELG